VNASAACLTSYSVLNTPVVLPRMVVGTDSLGANVYATAIRQLAVTATLSDGTTIAQMDPASVTFAAMSGSGPAYTPHGLVGGPGSAPGTIVLNVQPQSPLPCTTPAPPPVTVSVGVVDDTLLGLTVTPSSVPALSAGSNLPQPLTATARLQTAGDVDVTNL